jgi:hypothetical protein
MLSLPVNLSTFKKSFLDGDGSLDIASDKDLWKALYENGKPFSRDVQDLVDIKLGAATTRPLRFGRNDALALNVSISGDVQGRVDLIWPGEESEPLGRFNLRESLSAEQLYMAVAFTAKADAVLKGGMPVGPLSATFGVGAGGDVRYERLVRYAGDRPVKEILGDLFGGLRLPQHIDTIEDIPADGEVLATSYGGYLSLTSGLRWGYALTGTRSFELRDLKLELDYALRAVANATFKYRIAGEFSIEARRGAVPGWLRIVVRKSRQSEFNFAADFGFTGKADLNGLPESADEFLAALFGADVRTALDYLAKAEKYSSLDQLEKALGKLAKAYIQPLSQQIIGKALTDDTLEEFLSAVAQAVDSYSTMDRRVLELLTEYLDKLPQLDAVLGRILALDSPDGLNEMTDRETWDVIQRLSGDRIHDLLLRRADFGEFLALARRLKYFVSDAAAGPVRALVGQLKQSLRLDELLRQLEKYNTPDKLKGLADDRLQGLVEKLAGKAFDRLGDFRDASKRVNEALKNVSRFKEKWYEHVTAAVHQSVELKVNYAYTRATSDEALFDVEIDLAVDDGRALAGAAASGNFSGVMDAQERGIARLNPGAVFTRELKDAASLQINVFGWGYERISELLQNVEHAMTTERGGLIHVFTLETQIRQLVKETDRKKLMESIHSNFLLRAVGETLQPVHAAPPDRTRRYVVSTLRNMAVQYDMLYRDDRTSAAELSEYLELAEFLGLLRNRDLFVAELDRQFPDGLGKVTVTYIVRYGDQAVRNAFTLSGDQLANWSRRTARTVLGAKYTGMASTSWLARVGFAYQSPVFERLYYEKGFPAVLQEGRSVTLPRWFTGGPSREVALAPEFRQMVVTLFETESNYVKRLLALDELVDRSIQKGEPIGLDALQKASADFVGYADQLDNMGRENSFFAIFDKLVHEGSSGKWRRESAVVLDIEPPSGERVIKHLMA